MNMIESLHYFDIMRQGRSTANHSLRLSSQTSTQYFFAPCMKNQVSIQLIMIIIKTFLQLFNNYSIYYSRLNISRFNLLKYISQFFAVTSLSINFKVEIVIRIFAQEVLMMVLVSSYFLVFKSGAVMQGGVDSRARNQVKVQRCSISLSLRGGYHQSSHSEAGPVDCVTRLGHRRVRLNSIIVLLLFMQHLALMFLFTPQRSINALF